MAILPSLKLYAEVQIWEDVKNIRTPKNNCMGSPSVVLSDSLKFTAFS